MGVAMVNEEWKIVQLCLTYSCQCNCLHCGVRDINTQLKEELTLAQIERIFDDLKALHCQAIDLSGGEPTMRKDLFDIIRLGKQRQFLMTIETNGLNLTPLILAKLKQSKIDKVFLSIDDFRAEYHDRRRRHKGLFASIVESLKFAHKIGLDVHVSMVPENREYFIQGLANQYINFCLENGAARVRILFPSYVGNCSNSEKIFCSEEDELSLLGYIDKKYYDLVYVESEESYLSTALKDQKVICPAKSVFSYIATNGYVMPCPYLPIVFGDIRKESMIEILSRMREHPLMSQNGLYCPTRDKDFLQTMLKGLSPKNPFISAKSLNRIDCHAMCNNQCPDCPASRQGIDVTQLLKAVEKVDKKYKSIHLYGGEIFTHENIFPVLEKIGRDFKLVIYSNARVFVDHTFVDRLQKLNIKAIKVPFFSLSPKSFDRLTKTPGSYRQTLLGISYLCKAGIPVSVYIPEEEAKKDIALLKSLGVVSVSSFKRGDSDSLPDSVLCFGRHLQETRLLWLKG